MSWYRNDRPLLTGPTHQERIKTNRKQHQKTGSDVIVHTNNVTLESLSRDDVHTQLTCETSNFDATVLRTSVEIDMKCEFASYACRDLIYSQNFIFIVFGFIGKGPFSNNGEAQYKVMLVGINQIIFSLWIKVSAKY